MPAARTPLTDADRICYNQLNKDSIDYLMTSYNRVNRWVIADMIRRTRYHSPDKTALIFGDMSLTYARLEDECNQVANALQSMGIQEGDRVAIFLPNLPHYPAIFFGILKKDHVF